MGLDMTIIPISHISHLTIQVITPLDDLLVGIHQAIIRIVVTIQVEVFIVPTDINYLVGLGFAVRSG